MMKNKKNQSPSSGKKQISRKEALTKAGKYALFTAAASMMLLAPRKAMADPTSPGWGLPDGWAGPVKPVGKANTAEPQSPEGDKSLG